MRQNRWLAIPTEPVAYAVDTNNNLLVFNPLNPLPVVKKVVGLQEGEKINGLDFRPSTGQLYALGGSNRLYTLNTASGIASVVSKTPFDNQLSEPVVAFQFVQSSDRIRLKTAAGHTFLLNPIDGMIDEVEQTPAQSLPNTVRPAYTLLRTNDSTRIRAVNPTDGSSSLEILLPGNPVIRGFATGFGL